MAFSEPVQLQGGYDGSGSFSRSLRTNSQKGSSIPKGKNSGASFNMLKAPHTERKLVVGLLFPEHSKLQIQRIETDKYGKDIFLLMRHYYKEKYEVDLG